MGVGGFNYTRRFKHYFTNQKLLVNIVNIISMQKIYEIHKINFNKLQRFCLQDRSLAVELRN